MTETITREIDCVLCKETYSPTLGPEEGEKNYRIFMKVNFHLMKGGG